MLQELKNLLKDFNINSNDIIAKDNRVIAMESYNKSRGDLPDYDCPHCNNRGNFMVIKDGYEYFELCKCMGIRDTLRRMKESGLSKMFKKYSLDNFIAESPWQIQMLDLAKSFTKAPGGWIYIGGSSGSGKTHICTAIVNKLIRQGKDARYMLWRDTLVKLKSNITDDMAYMSIINPLKKTSVLYIDDFFKAAQSAPTPADINIAYEILNYRYNNKDLITIISSELILDDVFDLDMATASRIFEMAQGNILSITGGMEVNYRMKKTQHKIKFVL